MIWDSRYIVNYYERTYGIRHIGVLDEVPTKFMSPFKFLLGNELMEFKVYSSVHLNPLNCKWLEVVQTNVSSVYNGSFYVKENNICQIPEISKDNNYGHHLTKDHKVLNINSDYKIVLDTRYKPNTIKHVSIYGIHDSYNTRKLGKSYYHTENLTQYSNSSYNVTWSKDTHKLFGEYATQFVTFVIMCHKHSVNRKFVPRGVLYCIIQFILL